MSQQFIRQFTQDARALRRQAGLYMPDDLVVVRSRDADEAGDYRIARHEAVVGDPNWEITDIDPKDLD